MAVIRTGSGIFRNSVSKLPQTADGNSTMLVTVDRSSGSMAGVPETTVAALITLSFTSFSLAL